MNSQTTSQNLRVEYSAAHRQCSLSSSRTVAGRELLLHPEHVFLPCV
jgi:hypothetical protein